MHKFPSEDFSLSIYLKLNTFHGNNAGDFRLNVSQNYHKKPYFFSIELNVAKNERKEQQWSRKMKVQGRESRKGSNEAIH